MPERIAEPEIPCYVSAARVWEIGIKRAIGKIEARPNLVPIITEEDFFRLDITPAHAQAAAELPPLHPDPVDRMLIDQGVMESLVITTRNAVFRGCPVRLLRPVDS